MAANKSWLVMCLMLVITATGFAESVITANTSGGTGYGNGNYNVGQSVTTPTGNSWDNISFNLVNSSTKLPYAQGELFLLSASYADTAANLSSSTSGFLASTTDIVNGEWVFAPDVTLNPDTQYYFYTTTPFVSGLKILISGGNPYPGGSASEAIGTSPFIVAPSVDLVFTLNGTVAAVPEPATLALAALGALSLPLFRRRK